MFTNCGTTKCGGDSISEYCLLSEKSVKMNFFTSYVNNMMKKKYKEIYIINFNDNNYMLVT